MCSCLCARVAELSQLTENVGPAKPEMCAVWPVIGEACWSLCYGTLKRGQREDPPMNTETRLPPPALVASWGSWARPRRVLAFSAEAALQGRCPGKQYREPRCACPGDASRAWCPGLRGRLHGEEQARRWERAQESGGIRACMGLCMGRSRA